MEALLNLKNLIKKITPGFLLKWYHFLLAFFAALIYGFPSFNKKMKVIGITGTNGKSTVVSMVSKILEESGHSVACSSSIKFKIKEKEEKNVLRMTMPGRFRLQKFLKQSLNANCQYVVLEVTSEGIEQYRHKFINFDVALLTNLAPEHIEAHGSFEKYRQAKRKLFLATKNIHILNLDDKSLEYFSKIESREKYFFGLRNYKDNERTEGQSRENKVLAVNPKASIDGVSFEINDTLFKLSLLGRFNIYNALSAVCVGLSQGVGLEISKTALEKIKGIPGRMEIVISKPFSVLVDYAFTPNALEKIYKTIKASFKPQKMICVLGAAGGGRDKWKRPVLGRIAAEYCDRVIITNEDPYDENPMAIINQVAGGAGEKAKKILDRREAIRESLKEADLGDVVVITGKGAESCICVAGDKKIPWDDRIVVKEEFRLQKF